MEEDKLTFTIYASAVSPVVNPAFVLRHWEKPTEATVFVDGKKVTTSKKFRQGFARGSEGHLVNVIWLEMTSEKPVEFEIRK
jgi:hypothetical protein